MIWILMFIGMVILNIIGLIFILNRIAKFGIIQKITKQSKWKSRLIGGIFEVLAVAITYLVFGTWNVLIIYIHVLFFWVLSELVGKLINRIFKRENKTYIAGYVAIALSVIYLAYGYYMAHNVIETDYVFETQKDLGVEEDSFRVIAFADSHLGTTFGWQEFEGYIERMSALSPDIVVISGDYVDDDSNREDMVRCSEALGRLKAKYGVYFVLGNHDKAYYGSEARGFSEEDLINTLEANNVKVLRDEIYDVAGNVTVLGRLDERAYDRKSMSEYDSKIWEDKYVIALDHEPADYANEAAAGVDMVISGHTHGGQFFPINNAGVWLGINDKTYGTETRGNTNFIVTSGIGDWALDFKTGCVSEYVVIDIKEK